MPFTLFHGLISYIIVSRFTHDKKLRLLAFCAAWLPDLDGLPILFDMHLYNAIHHELFHPPVYGLLLAVPAALVLHHFFKIGRLESFIVFSFSFALHPFTDIFFGFLPIRLFWPVSNQGYANMLSLDWHTNLYLNFVVALVLSLYGWFKLRQFALKTKSRTFPGLFRNSVYELRIVLYGEANAQQPFSFR